jgi:hypothetical protein
VAETGYPFDAGPGAAVLEGEWQRMGREWLASGVITGRLNQLAVTADGSVLGVTVASGRAWVDGFFYQNDAAKAIGLAAADATNPRIDRIVVRMDRTGTTNTITTIALTGTPAASPTPPALTQTDEVFDVLLADVTVPAAAGVIVAGNVTDRRVLTDAGYSRGASDGRFAQLAADNLLSGFNNHHRGALGNAAGDTRDVQNVVAGTTTNLVRLLGRLVRTAAGSDHATAGIDLIRVTDATSQAFLRWLSDRVQAFGDAFQVLGNLLVSGGIDAPRHRAAASLVTTVESTTSTVYTSLTTVDEVRFVGPPSGLATLVWFATMANDTAGQISLVSTNIVRVSDGALIAAADDGVSARKPQTGDQTHGMSRRVTVSSGVEYAARLRYRVSGGTGTFYNRTLTVTPST